MAVISPARHRLRQSVRVAGDKMDDSILEYIKRKHNTAIGERTAEEIQNHPRQRPAGRPCQTMDIKGRELVVSIPQP